MVSLPGRGPGALAVLDFGPKARPVDLVLLHANGFNALTYRHILEPLAAHFRILAPDMRGHGASTLPAIVKDRTGWDDFRDDLLAMLQTLAIEGAVLSGHSLGGTTCLSAAPQARNRVRRLVLLDPVIPPRGPMALDSEHDLIAGARRRRAHFPDRASVLAAYAHRKAFAGWAGGMLADYVEAGFVDAPEGGVRLACAPAWEASTYALAPAVDVWPALQHPPCPVEILIAESDSTCRIEGEAERVSRKISSRVIADASHFLPMERPDLVVAALADALARS